MAHPHQIFDRLPARAPDAGRLPLLADLPVARVVVRADDATPASLLAALIDEHRALARDRGVALRLAVSTALPALRVDRARLSRLLAHAVGDAIGATPRGGVVTVTAALRAGELVFAIRDDGRDGAALVRIAVPAAAAR